MTCRRCAREIEADSVFCRYCGAPAQEPASPRRLTRRPAEGKLGGVCAGIAAYLHTDPTWVRLLWAILSVVPGVLIGGLIAYVVAWILLPSEQSEVPRPTAVQRLRRSATDRKIAGVCGG
ncbi:MAG: PspC domain-containing protein, partial [Dongiaceae bacterium]